jgi:16S rRNA (cytidine1402-2'-O)-methyltransferase
MANVQSHTKNGTLSSKDAHCGKLVICPTPIGNLGDVSFRIKDALENCDVVYAEDTRVTAKLLNSLDIKQKLERCDEAKLKKKAGEILELIEQGQCVAYCSDAGMPGISDPGLRLVALARARAIKVEVLPGPVAAATAYVASGCTNKNFYFGGFLPRKESQRVCALNALCALDAALIFYESPKRLVDSLCAIAKVFPKRNISVCRELTKLHEEVYRANSLDVLEEFQAREQSQGIKGEIVIVIDGVCEKELANDSQEREASAKNRAKDLKEQGYKNKDIVAALVEEFEISRNAAYDIALSTKA